MKQGTRSNDLSYGAKPKNEVIYITLAIAVEHTHEITEDYYQSGSSYPNIPPTIGNYPLSSVGDGIYGYSTYEASFDNAISIAGDIANTVCRNTVPINGNECQFNEVTNLCECEDVTEVTIIDKVTPIEVTNQEYFRDVYWTIDFKFEEK